MFFFFLLEVTFVSKDVKICMELDTKNVLTLSLDAFRKMWCVGGDQAHCCEDTGFWWQTALPAEWWWTQSCSPAGVIGNCRIWIAELAFSSGLDPEGPTRDNKRPVNQFRCFQPQHQRFRSFYEIIFLCFSSLDYTSLLHRISYCPL